MKNIEKVFIVVFIGLIFYFALFVLETNDKLNEKNKELEELNNKIIEIEITNAELNSELQSTREELILVDRYNEMFINENCEHIYYLSDLIEPIKYIDKEAYYDLYRGINELYLDESETIYDCMTEEDIKYIQQCVETETYDCPFEAKVNVACVILNRVEDDNFPSNAKSVVTSPNQFAYGRTKITESTIKAVEYAFEIGNEEIENCIGFRSDINPQYWNGWEYAYTDGKHYFYKNNN